MSMLFCLCQAPCPQTMSCTMASPGSPLNWMSSAPSWKTSCREQMPDSGPIKGTASHSQLPSWAQITQYDASSDWEKSGRDFPQSRLQHQWSSSAHNIVFAMYFLWLLFSWPSDLPHVLTEKRCLGHTGISKKGTWRWHPQRSSVLRTCREPGGSGTRRTTSDRSHASSSKHRDQRADV